MSNCNEGLANWYKVSGEANDVLKGGLSKDIGSVWLQELFGKKEFFEGF